MGRIHAILLALCLTLPVILVLAAPASAGTTRVLTITSGSAKPKVAFGAFDAHPPKAWDINGDGKMEIIAQNDNRWVYVFDSKTGKLLGEVTTKYPGGWGARSINGPEASVLVTGGKTHLIVANSAAYITDFRFDGISNGRFVLTKVWERRLTDCHGDPSMDSKVVFADLDKDGDLEILAQTEEVGVYALQHTGAILWKKCIGGGNAEPGVGDLNGDGQLDVAWPSDGGTLTAMNGRTGATLWSRWLGGAMPTGPAVAQLDGKGGADVVVGVRNKHDCTNFKNNHATLFAYSGGGTLLWKKQPSMATPLSYTHPIIADVDANGQKDVLWADWNTQGHKCGNWEVVGQSHVYRFDATGAQRWVTTTAAYWHNKDLALADVDKDGVQEVLAVGTSGGHEGVWYLNSRTGAKETFVTAWPWKVTRGPIVENLWGAGTMQWFIPVAAYGSGSSGFAIQVYDTGVPFNAMWPHVPYVSA